MEIQTVPFESISEAHLRALIDRGATESRTLDFKREMALSDSGKFELLKDVTAMANASGGMLVYGAEEGEDDDRGKIVALPGMALIPDSTELTVGNLLRDGIDERIAGVLHRAVPLSGGSYAYVIRVPASPAAPHMVTVKSSKLRYWMRGTVSNDPMNARQVKESSIRAASAYERASQFLAERRQALRMRAVALEQQVDAEHRPLGQAALHVVPLFPREGGFAFSDSSVLERLASVPVLGRAGPAPERRLSIAGLYCFSRFSHPYDQRYNLFSRRGAIEFQEYDIVRLASSTSTGPYYFDVKGIEDGVVRSLEACERLSADGLLPTPVAISLSLFSVRGSQLYLPASPTIVSRAVNDDELVVGDLVLSEWSERDGVARQLLDVVWQCWGYTHSPTFALRGVPVSSDRS